MTDNSSPIPVVSIASIAANVPEENINNKVWCQVGEQLVKAFTDTGFCYIKDHGIDQNLIDKSFHVGKEFFHLPLETKKQRLRGEGVEDYFGWLPRPHTEGIDRKPETFEANMIPDYKETYNLSDNLDESRFPTDDEVQDFRETTVQIMKKMELVSNRLLIALGHALKLEDPHALWKTSSKTGTSENDTTLRYAFYPHIPNELMKEKNMLRCGEHTDFGHITLLVDNGVSGLQIKKRDGEYLMVPRREGSIVVNISDALERMSGGILRSAPHRVVINEESAKEDRYSIVYFRVPDYSAYMDPLCGAKEKYQERLVARDFFARRFNEIFVLGAGIGQNSTTS